jgi:NAD(P)-dependent dehydrogenase (short-subunit alcohol dehydrogenase family)
MQANQSLKALVTGGASGLGLAAAQELACRGYRVVIADRNITGGEAAVKLISEQGGSAEFRQLDLGDLEAIRKFATEIARDQTIDVLLNNAGLLPPAQRTTTKDGFELAFGVAYLGHFALTGQLLPALLRSSSPRVVCVSSNSHPRGRINFSDLELHNGYTASGAYMNCKLACLMFAFELQRRAAAARLNLSSVAAHPGVSRTPIAAGWQSENRTGIWDRFELLGYQVFVRFFDRDAAEGARSLVYAATRPDIEPGGYYGPTGFMQGRGEPGQVKPAVHALNMEVASRLWRVSEELTGVHWDMSRPE